MANVKRYLFPVENDEVDAIKQGFVLLLKILEKEHALNCTIFIPTKAQLEGTSLSLVLGEELAKALQKKVSVKLGDCELAVETSRSMSERVKCDVVLVVYADQEMMDLVDSNVNPGFVLAVPYSANALDRWQLTWSPSVAGSKRVTLPIIEDAVFEAALRSLTHRVNLANKVLNARDKEAAQDLFKVLRAHGHAQDSDNVCAWLIKNGWDPKTAKETAGYGEKILSSKSKPRSYGTHWANDIYEKWKAGG